MNRSNHRHGVTLAWAMVTLITLVSLLSLAVDLGKVQLAQAELQAAADSAANHALGGLDDGTWQSRAIDAAQDNMAAGAAVSLAAGDVELGTWNLQNSTFTPGGATPNAVRVTARRTSAAGDAIPLVLGPILGIDTIDVAESSIALRRESLPSRNLVALYEFNDGSGTVVRDTSSTGAAADLIIQDPANTTWQAGGGLRINSATRLTSASTKIASMLKSSNRFTIEVRFNPTKSSATSAADANLLTIGDGASDSGVRMALRSKGMTGVIRSSTTTPGGTPLTPTSGNHVPGQFNNGYSMVTTYNGTMFRLGGRRHADNALRYRSVSPGGTLDWNSAATLTVGAEADGSNAFTGTISRIAIYDYDINTTDVDTLLKTGVMPEGTSTGGPTTATRSFVR
jgi:hypothetical protein